MKPGDPRFDKPEREKLHNFTSLPNDVAAFCALAARAGTFLHQEPTLFLCRSACGGVHVRGEPVILGGLQRAALAVKAEHRRGQWGFFEAQG